MSASAITVKTVSHWIGGEAVQSTSGRSGTRQRASSVAEVDLAVASAKAAFRSWRATPLAKVVTSRWPDPATSCVDLGFPQVR